MALVFLLAACVAQTTNEACNLMEERIESSPLLEQESFSQAELAGEYRSIAADLKNDQVRSAVTDAAAVMERHAEILDRSVDDPDSMTEAELEQLAEAEAELETAGERLDVVCRPH